MAQGMHFDDGLPWAHRHGEPSYPTTTTAEALQELEDLLNVVRVGAGMLPVSGPVAAAPAAQQAAHDLR